MFAGASHVAISGGTFVNHNRVEKSATAAFDKLSGAAAHSALHNAPARTDETRCYQHTRTNVLDHLERWAQGICDEGSPIFWLHGGAGAGKTAIMQTLSERCEAQGLALGSFFFSRSDATRNTAQVLIPTLAYQLAQLFPSALQVLEPIIDRDPLIFKKSLQVQLINSLVQPLQHLVELGIINDAAHSPRVFLIDGLDECDDSGQQQAIIQAVATVCHEHHIPVKFLVASRSELAISTSFQLYKQANYILGAISLSEDPDAETDIRRFIENQFSKIHLQHPFKESIPSDWPHVDDINKLVRKSSSHFIYASTAMRYIWSAKETPVRSLQVVLGLNVSRTVSPFAELDALYRHIFQSAGHVEKVLQIIAHCLFAHLPSSVSIICIMHEYSLSDFSIFMADMAPLISISESTSYLVPEKEVKLLHASLEDFLFDRARSGSLHISGEVYLASKLERCIQVLDLYSRNQRTEPDWPESSISPLTTYSNLYFQIFATTRTTGHLSATQEVLWKFGFRGFHECLLRIRNIHPGIHEDSGLQDVTVIFIAVLLTAATDSNRPFKSYLEDLFDIFESYLSLESTPLAPIILPLIFSGYSRRAVCDILSDHCYGKPSYELVAERFYKHESKGFMTSVLDYITAADLASVRHSGIYSSPERLAVAAEAILGYLIDGARRHHSAPYSTHKSWLLRAKPGKHAATGALRLASVFPACHPNSLGPLDGPGSIQSARGPPRRQIKMVVNLLNALLWLLPKAELSEEIALYSNRTIPQNLYQCGAGLCRRVKRYLDEYNTRFQSAKLLQLDQRIENGHVKALVEKLHILDINAQD